MLVGFARYSRDGSFIVLSETRIFVLAMAAGSSVGSFIGGRLLGLVPSSTLLPLLAIILVLLHSRYGGTNRQSIAEWPISSRTVAFSHPRQRWVRGSVRIGRKRGMGANAMA